VNLLITPTEIKAGIPDGIRATTTKYDQPLLVMAQMVSRFWHRHCGRSFFPELATRYFDAAGKQGLVIDDLLSITQVSVSDDNGATYTNLVVDTDYWATVWGDPNAPQSWNQLVVNPNSLVRGAWPAGRRAVKIVGLWGYADDRATAWEDSTDEVESNPLAVGAVSLTVNDADGPDLLGVTPRFQAGQLLRIESEFAYCSATNTATQVLIIARSRNGTVDAEHIQNKQIDIWRPPAPMKQAAMISTVRVLERGFQAYGDARANAELGQLIYMRAMDPEALVLAEPYRLVTAG